MSNSVASSEYATDLSNLKKQIEDITKIDDNDIGADALINLNDTVERMQSRYGTITNKGFITLVDVAGSKNEFKISIDDFLSLDGMQGKNFMDLIKDGKVTVKEGNKAIKKGTYEVRMESDRAADKYLNNFLKRINKEINAFVTDESRVRYGVTYSDIEHSIKVLLGK